MMYSTVSQSLCDSISYCFRVNQRAKNGSETPVDIFLDLKHPIHIAWQIEDFI